MLFSSTPAARKILIHNETLKSAELARRAANVPRNYELRFSEAMYNLIREKSSLRGASSALSPHAPTPTAHASASA